MSQEFLPSRQKGRQALMRAVLCICFLVIWLSSPWWSSQEMSVGNATLIAIGCLIAGLAAWHALGRWANSQLAFRMTDEALSIESGRSVESVPWNEVMSIRTRVSGDDLRLYLVDHEEDLLAVVSLGVFDDGGVAFLHALSTHLERIFRHESSSYLSGLKDWAIASGERVIILEDEALVLQMPKSPVHRLPLHTLRFVEWRPAQRSGSTGGRLVIADQNRMHELPQAIAGLPFLLYALGQKGIAPLVNPTTDCSGQLGDVRSKQVSLGVRAIWLFGLAVMFAVTLISHSVSARMLAQLPDTGTAIPATVAGLTEPNRVLIRWQEADGEQAQKVVSVKQEAFASFSLNQTLTIRKDDRLPDTVWFEGMPIYQTGDYTWFRVAVWIVVVSMVLCGLRALLTRRNLTARRGDLEGRFLDELPPNPLGPAAVGSTEQATEAQPPSRTCSHCGCSVEQTYYETDQGIWCQACQLEVEFDASERSRILTFGFPILVAGFMAIGWWFAIIRTGEPLQFLAVLIGMAVGMTARSQPLRGAPVRTQRLALLVTYLFMSWSLVPSAWIQQDEEYRDEIVKQYNEAAAKTDGMPTVESFEALRSLLWREIQQANPGVLLGLALMLGLSPLIYPLWLLQIPLGLVWAALALWQTWRFSRPPPQPAFGEPKSDGGHRQ